MQWVCAASAQGRFLSAPSRAGRSAAAELAEIPARGAGAQQQVPPCKTKTTDDMLRVFGCVWIQAKLADRGRQNTS